MQAIDMALRSQPHFNRPAVCLYVLIIFLWTLANKTVLPSFSTDWISYWAFELITSIGLPLVLLLVLKYRFGVAPSAYGLCTPAKSEFANALLAFGTAVVAFYFVMNPLREWMWTLMWRFGSAVELQAAFVQAGSQNEMLQFEAFGGPHAEFFMVIDLAGASLIEEVIYRALLYRLLVPRTTVYLVVSSSLFATIHYDQGLLGILSSLVFGVVAATIFLWVKNVWPLAFAHYATNLIALLDISN
ncbi:MAG: CPBP family intramembrane glutamic endopeptidase [Burkholderiales bacterium]